MLPRPSRTHAAIPEANVASQAIPTATPDTTATKIPSLATIFSPYLLFHRQHQAAQQPKSLLSHLLGPHPSPTAMSGTMATQTPSFATIFSPHLLTHSNIMHPGNQNSSIGNHFSSRISPTAMSRTMATKILSSTSSQSSSPHLQQYRAPQRPNSLHSKPLLSPYLLTHSNIRHHGNQKPFIRIRSALILSATGNIGQPKLFLASIPQPSSPHDPHWPVSWPCPRWPPSLQIWEQDVNGLHTLAGHS